MNKTFCVLDNLVIATKNSEKLKELQELLNGTANSLLTFKDINWHSPIENGKTFEENAIIKSSNVAKATGIPAIADDTGLCVDNLNGLPGIYTAGWAANGKDFILGIEKIQKLLNSKPSKSSYVSSIAFCLPNGDHYSFTGIIYGNIVFPSKGDIIGYESIFVPNGFNTSLSSLPSDIRMKIHHRTQSIKKFKTFLYSTYL